MRKSVVEACTGVGLVVSLLAVLDMLARWDSPVLNALYLAWGLATAAAIVLVLIVKRVRLPFQTMAAGGSKLLGVRTAASILLLLLGWYVNGASTALYGADSAMVADNGGRMFCILFTVVAHVVYLAYTKRTPDDAVPPRWHLGKRR